MAAERGAARNSLLAYGQRPDGLCAGPGPRRCLTRNSHDQPMSATICKALETRGLARRTAARRLSAIRQFHAFLHSEGFTPKNPAQIVESPKQAAQPAGYSRRKTSIAPLGNRGGRSGSGSGKARLQGLAPACACVTPRRHGLARVGTGGPHPPPACGRYRHAVHQGQGRARAHGSRGTQLRAACSRNYLSFLATHDEHLTLGLPVPRQVRHPHAPAFCPGTEGARRTRWHRPRSASRPTCCAMALPHVCSTMVPTCAPCSRCWATPTSRQPRSTPMCRPRGSRRRWRNFTPSSRKKAAAKTR
jgi:hypothetical protein